MILVRNLAFRTLSIPELIIPPGSAALIGPNGSGKTTFLLVLAGILKPEQCSVRINGKSPGECRIGFVNEYPDRNILFSRVSDEISSPLRFSRLPCEEISRNVELALERAGLLHLMNRRIHTLSGGEKTLVALLAATIQSPKYSSWTNLIPTLTTGAADAADQVIRGQEPRQYYGVRRTWKSLPGQKPWSLFSTGGFVNPANPVKYSPLSPEPVSSRSDGGHPDETDP